jgi:phospholipase/carboxylesterase
MIATEASAGSRGWRREAPRDAPMTAPVFRERRAASPASGLLVLHHGRGADEHDLLPLADALDPAQRLHVVTPRAPLTIAGWPGNHWYLVPRVGYPDADSFHAAYALQRTVLGGFSMGSVMSYALALGADRPAPAGILAFSGFIPTVDGWQPQLADRSGVRASIAHGRNDPVISVEFARGARQKLVAAGLDVSYHEFAGGHEIDPSYIPAVRDWLQDVLPDEPPGPSAAR